MPEPKTILIAPNDFNLAHTLTCGQAFRWKPLPDQSFSGVVYDRTCRVQRQGEKLIITGDPLSDACKFWRSYFDLDTDYAVWRDHIAAYPALKPAVAWSSGIRLLRQPPWEALVSFIISQNNHLTRITGIIDRLCCLYGEALGNGQYAFPTPGGYPHCLRGLCPAALRLPHRVDRRCVASYSVG
jgi:N-glycosylase/DNA lyase